MSPLQTKIVWTSILLVIAIGVVSTIQATPDAPDVQRAAQQREVHELLPASTVLFANVDGARLHEDAWKKTAAYEAFYETGLAKLADDILEFLLTQAAGTSEMPAQALLDTIAQEGFAVSVALSDAPGLPLPRVTVILRNAAERIDVIDETVKSLDSQLPIKYLSRGSRKIRRVLIPRVPAAEIGWWAAEPHIVITAGIGAIEETLRVADGQAPSLREHRLWKATTNDDATSDFETTQTLWCDVAKLRAAYGGLPIPHPSQTVTVEHILKIIGLDKVDSLVSQSGYDGRAVRTVTKLNTDGKLTGLLSVANQKSITWDSLPPLPDQVENFWAGSLDLSQVYGVVLKTAAEVSDLAGPNGKDAKSTLEHIPEIVGFDPQKDLLSALGNVHCIYGDPGQGFLGTGGAVVTQVRDARKLRKTVDTILARIEAVAGNENFRVQRTQKLGREFIVLEFNESLQLGALTIDRDWMVLGFVPQTLEAFCMRVDGDLPRWDRQRLAKAGITDVPDQFGSVAYNDPRSSYQALLKLAPFGMSVGIGALKEARIIPRNAELPIRVADIPAAERVVRPMFPNFVVSQTSDAGLQWTSRRSVPNIPFVSGIGGGNGLVAASTLTALVLPAIQQARIAAQRSESTGHLKQLALALHNYHETYGHLPAGTMASEKLDIDERLSWLAAILPYLEQTTLYKTLDTEAGWADKENKQAAQTMIPYLMNPGYPQMLLENKYAPTHYVGMAGVGKDAPGLPRSHPRAGIFGHDQSTRFAEVRDGLSNTIMVTETSQPGPWASGGNGLRALTQKPYINGPDGIGGPFPGGVQVGLGDGSVHFISENIDPKIFEALSTMAGGEKVGAF